MVGHLTSSQEDVTNLYKVGQHAVRFLMGMATCSSGGCCCARPRWPARCSTPAPPGATSTSTKARSPSRLFARQVLPELSSRRTIVEGADSIMELDVAAL